MGRVTSGLLATAAVLALNGVAAADCAGSQLQVEPSAAAAGQQVQVTGTALSDGVCDDTGGCALRRPDEQRPSRGATLQVVAPDGSVTQLGEFEPEGDTYGRTKTIRVPTLLAPGAVEVQAVREDGTVIAVTRLVVRP